MCLATAMVNKSGTETVLAKNISVNQKKSSVDAKKKTGERKNSFAKTRKNGVNGKQKKNVI